MITRLTFIALFCVLFAVQVSVFGQFRSASTAKVEYTAPPKKLNVSRITVSLAAVAGKAFAVILTTPGAEVWVDGANKGQSDDNGNFRFDMNLKKNYKVEVKKDRYISFNQEVSADKVEPVIVQAALQPTFGGIEIYNVPSGAKILLNDKEVPTTVDEEAKKVLIVDINAQSYTMKINHPNFVPWERDIDVVGGYNLGLSPTLVPASRLKVQTMASVDVLIDKIKQGATDGNGLLQISTPLQPGEHQVTLMKEGFVTQTQTVNLQASVDNNFAVEELEPNPSYTELVDFFNEGYQQQWDGQQNWKWAAPPKAEVTISGDGSGLLIGRAKGRSFRDFEFAFDIRFVNGAGASWVIRSPRPDSYYLFEIKLKEQKLYSYIVVKGDKKEIGVPTPILVPLNNTTSFQVRADVQGNRVRHYIKNNETADEEIMGVFVNGGLKYGTVGFTATNGQVYAIKQVVVRPYPESAAPPPTN